MYIKKQGLNKKEQEMIKDFMKNNKVTVIKHKKLYGQSYQMRAESI